MIIISVNKNEKSILKISVSGHAGFNSYGNDIVCAGVSAVTFGFLEYLQITEEKGITYETFEKENKIVFFLKNQKNKFFDKIFNILYIQLKLIYNNYKKNIKWIETYE
ncbi:ribosomal-processing cysteine protease Prp [symbiont of Argiope bruennichi]|uniref:ribosomal-processing cysteine protease Prp n=1 Tax=symbiont of Argiope bruennichi TaxID=2810479 RepID=UPI003DA6616B